MFESNDCNNNTQYYSTDELLDVIDSGSRKINIVCSNIRSLKSKFDSFKEFLCETEVYFNVIGLVETWLDDKPHDYFHLSGYSSWSELGIGH